MLAEITQLPVGTKFSYKYENFEVVDRESYPFIEAKCLTEPNNYEGLNVLFWNFETVHVPSDTQLVKFQPKVYKA